MLSNDNLEERIPFRESGRGKKGVSWVCVSECVCVLWQVGKD